MMKYQSQKRMASALALAMTLTPGLAPAMAVNQSSLLPWRAFLLSLHLEKGVYYVVSPEIVEPPPLASSIGDIDARYKRLALIGGYVIIYGENEKIASRVELAKHNMAVITSELAASPRKLDSTLLMAGGVLDFSDQYSLANSECSLNVVRVPLVPVTEAAIGEGLVGSHVCVGFGIIAGLAGYRVIRREHALELQRVIDVTQGAQIDRCRAPGSQHPGQRPPVKGEQKQQPT